MSRHGQRLADPDPEGVMVCPESGYRYCLRDGALRCLDLDEELPLPAEKAKGEKSYREFRTESGGR